MSRIIKKEEIPMENLIRFLIGDLERESKKLLKIEQQLDNSKEEYIRDLVINDLTDAIIKYSKIMQELRIKLETFFVYEEKNNIPRNLAFYRMYKKITKV